jgi:hypothetical protein
MAIVKENENDPVRFLADVVATVAAVMPGNDINERTFFDINFSVPINLLRTNHYLLMKEKNIYQHQRLDSSLHDHGCSRCREIWGRFVLGL